MCTAGTYHRTSADNGTLSPEIIDSVVRYTTVEQHEMMLGNLKPNCSYSCVIEGEGMVAGKPCQFFTTITHIAVCKCHT